MEIYENYQKFSNDLKNLLNSNDNFSDFQIVCRSIISNKETLFNCHKSILSARSDYFKSMFNSKMKEFHEGKLILTDASQGIVSEIINYFYTGKIQLTSNNAIEILIFSSKYLIDELIQVSSDFVKKYCSIENVVEIFKMAEVFNLEDLHNFCYQFILDKLPILLKSSYFQNFEENHIEKLLLNDNLNVREFDLFQALIHWAKYKNNIPNENINGNENLNGNKNLNGNQNLNENQNLNGNQNLNENQKEMIQDTISNLVDKIRFIDFSHNELEQTLNSNLIPNKVSRIIQKFHSFSSCIKKEFYANFLKRLHDEEKEANLLNSLIFHSRFPFKSEIVTERTHFEYLQEWINDNDLFKSLKLGFSTKSNGFSSAIFHQRCDDKGPTLVLIKSKNGYIFGGFTKVGFKPGNPGKIYDNSAFIFTLKNPSSYPCTKFPIQHQKGKYALFSISKKGPCFGGGYNDLPLGWDGVCDIDISSPDLKKGKTDIGFVYELPVWFTRGTSEIQGFFTGSFEFEIEEIEVFIK
ncbi:pep-cterm sorting domain-containing protein [Anaeramoeba ignava]|uniref:Pep-cterm sorting domain-containing protein n=1 Tax=Anaeramoeba ignava TaxID=1746090 RepID=A0A9Q0LAS1_ANAIG|nr:pep-cterm sorting domain-containing protein [Anaeramoeba ignava]